MTWSVASFTSAKPILNNQRNSLNNVSNSVNAAANEQSSSSNNIESVNNIEGARNVESVNNISNVELRCNNNSASPMYRQQNTRQLFVQICRICYEFSHTNC